jgi:hypothetical protein
MTLVGLLAALEGRSLYRVFTIYQKLSNRNSCFSQSTFSARPWRVWLEAGSSLFGCFCRLYWTFGTGSLGEFFGYFFAGGLFFQRGLESKTEELTRSVDLEGAAAVVRQMGTRDGSEHGLLYRRCWHKQLSYRCRRSIKRPGGIASRQILGLPVSWVICCGSYDRFNALFGATSLDKPERRRTL